MRRTFLACALVAAVAVCGTEHQVRADDGLPLLPWHTPSAVDRALLPLGPPPRIEVMNRAGGTALLVAGSILAGVGWLVGNGALLVYATTDPDDCGGGVTDCDFTPTQKKALGFMIGGGAVTVIGVPMLVYGSAVRERDTPKRPSRWGTGSLHGVPTLSYAF